MPDPALLVPIHVDALLVNARVASGAFERWTNNWVNLNRFADPVPPPWGSSAPVPHGVHLHWRMPSALTHSVLGDGQSQPIFPHTPNRWIVVRLVAPSDAAGAPDLTAWIIESDYTDAVKGTTPFIAPDSSPTNLKPTLLGRHLKVSEWQGETVQGKLFLNATGIADPAFLAFQPGLIDVYAFVDDTSTLPENSHLTYLVAGWYSDAASDPLQLQGTFDADTGLFRELSWSALGLGKDDPVPGRAVFHGLVNGLTWQTAKVPPRTDSDASAMQVAIGYTAIDALAAMLARGDSGGALPPERLEMMLAAFQYDSLALLDAADATAQLELRIRKAWFGSVPGGTMWQVKTIAQGQATADPLSNIAQPASPSLSPAQEQWLAALNVAQRAHDRATRELRTLQEQLFALWWKAQFIAGAPVIDNSGVDPGVMTTQLLTQITPGIDGNFRSIVAAAQAAVDNAPVPDPTSAKSIAEYSRLIPDNVGSLALQPVSLPSFHHPADPVVLVGGITPPANAPEDGQPLPCRIATAAVTGVTIPTDGAGTPVNAASGTVAVLLPKPTVLSAANGHILHSLLDPAVADAIDRLTVEAVFADSSYAAAIVQHGLSRADPALASALATTMTAGTAQIATIADSLAARFAFAPWSQAWAPLFVEWDLQFYPTVQTSPTGPALPVAPLLSRGGSAEHDNLPIDMAGWTFDGSDHVFARGSEYYRWAGGDIWSANSWIVPQGFTGRSILTPNAENLFIARLEEFIADQPVASAVAVVTDGKLSAITLGSGGSGYGAAPSVTLSGGGGSGAAARARLAHGTIIGIDVIDPGQGYTAPPQVTIGASDWSTIRNLIDKIGATRFLSQSLGGFNDNFVMKHGIHSLSPDKDSAALMGGEDRLVPEPGLGNLPFQFGHGQPFFFPVRGGFFCFRQLQIVDAFGQVLDLLQANGNASGDAPSFRPILGHGLAPEPAAASPDRQIKQAPRIVQPSRIDLNWLDATSGDELYFAPGVNPVCGWLIPNHLDRSIAAYDTAGNGLGALIVLAQSDGQKKVRWLPAAGSNAAVNDPALIGNRHLAGMLSAFTRDNGGIVGDRVAAFETWFAAIDETLWTVDPPGSQGNANLAVLIGRPLALVQLQVQMELFGRPDPNQSWRDTFILTDPSDPGSLAIGWQDAGLGEISVPLRLGSVELLDDGTIGYFLGDDFTAFNAIHVPADANSAYVRPVAGNNYLPLSCNWPDYAKQTLSLLIDPFGTVHATSGILPVAEIDLPPQFYTAAIANLAVSFRIGPVLTAPDAVRMPLAPEAGGVWSWLWHNAPDTLQHAQVLATTDQANLAAAPPHMMEGWLVLSPAPPTETR